MTNDERRSLILRDLLRDDIESKALGIWDAYRVLGWCNKRELDDRGCRIVIARWKRQRAAAAIAKTVERLGYEVAECSD